MQRLSDLQRENEELRSMQNSLKDTPSLNTTIHELLEEVDELRNLRKVFPAGDSLPKKIQAMVTLVSHDKSKVNLSSIEAYKKVMLFIRPSSVLAT